MEKRYYDAAALEAELREFEVRFGMSSESFHALHMRSKAPQEIDPHDAFVWAYTYRDVRRLRGHAGTHQ